MAGHVTARTSVEEPKMTDHEHHPPIARFNARPLPGTDKIIVSIGGADHVIPWDDAYTLAQCLAVALDCSRRRDGWKN